MFIINEYPSKWVFPVAHNTNLSSFTGIMKMIFLLKKFSYTYLLSIIILGELYCSEKCYHPISQHIFLVHCKLAKCLHFYLYIIIIDEMTIIFTLGRISSFCLCGSEHQSWWFKCTCVHTHLQHTTEKAFVK
jgi:hypothetical protein